MSASDNAKQDVVDDHAQHRHHRRASVDITSDQGREQASAGKSPLSLYLQQMGNMQRDAFERFYDSTVDHSCTHMLSCEHSNLLVRAQWKQSNE
jgi:hypothetical protein